MTNEEWLEGIRKNELASVYKILIQNITPSLKDSIALLKFIKTMANNPESMPKIKQILYKNFPSSKDRERIEYVFSSHEGEEDSNNTPVS